MRIAKPKNFIYILFTLISILIASYIIGNRNLEVGTDTLTYTNIFLSGNACKCVGTHEPGFELFVYPMYLFSFTPPYIFTILSLLIFFLVFLISKKIVDNIFFKETDYIYKSIDKYKYYIALFSLFIITPMIIQTHINAIRQGISALFLLLSFMYLIENKKKLSFIIMLLSISFHYSALLIVPFYILFFYFRIPTNFIFAASIFFFSLLSVLYILGFSETFVYSTSNFLNLPIWSSVKEYGAGSNYRVGVRYDFYFFTLFLMVPAFIHALKSSEARIYFSFIAISTFPFLLLGWGAYSNRYLLNAWIYIFFGIGSYLLSKYRKLSSLSLLFFLASIIYNVIFISMKG